MHAPATDAGVRDRRASAPATIGNVFDAHPEPAPRGSLASVRAREPGMGRVAIHSVAVVGASGRCTVSVELRRNDDQAVAVLEGVLAVPIARRMIADATVKALTSLEPAASQVGVEAVTVAQVGSHAVVTVTLVHALAQTEEVFAGSAVVRPAGEYEAVARAVLDGTNRRIIEA
jgi:hypothetical protein